MLSYDLPHLLGRSYPESRLYYRSFLRYYLLAYGTSFVNITAVPPGSAAGREGARPGGRPRLMSTPAAAALPLAAEPLLTPAEVGALFRVDPKTVWRWGRQGKLKPIRTAGGHSRFRESEVRALLAGDPSGQEVAP